MTGEMYEHAEADASDGMRGSRTSESNKERNNANHEHAL
jgi:hypothetical protein